MKEFIKPNWNHCNVNISATIAEFLGAPNKNETLPILKKELKKEYKNIVFICFDGLGINPMNINLSKDDILWKNCRDILTSTFPSTTTNATTSLSSNTLPREHGWFGWSMYFENINKNIDVFYNTNSWDDTPVDVKDSPLGKVDYYFDNVNTDYEINTVFPPYIMVKNKNHNNIINNVSEMISCIERICLKDRKQFIYAYYPEPDATMHKFGVTSKETKLVLEDISKNIEYLYKNTKNTLFIITADHGQVDITETIRLHEDKKLMDMLVIYPYLESRVSCFKVKTNMHQEFENYFNEKYGKDFKLFKTKDLIKDNYFGKFGDKENLLSDFISIGTFTHKAFALTPNASNLKGNHSSLTEEMEVPLILLNN